MMSDPEAEVLRNLSLLAAYNDKDYVRQRMFEEIEKFLTKTGHKAVATLIKGMK